MPGSHLTVGILLYQDYETLDVMGPVEFLGVPCVKEIFNMLFISCSGDPVRSAQGVITTPGHSFASCPVLDVLLVPGKTQHPKPSVPAAVSMYANLVSRITKACTVQQEAQAQGS